MATTLTGTTGASVGWTYSKDPGQISVSVNQAGVSFGTIYKSTDTGATLASKKYDAIITITNGAANTTLTLSALVDSFGDTVNMTKVKALYFECTSGAGNIRPGIALTLALITSLDATNAASNSTMVKPITSGQKWMEESATNSGFNSTNATIVFQNSNGGSTFVCKAVLIGD
jgi:hypothetical protein